MADSNGHVTSGHLVQFGAVMVSAAIFRKVVVTSTDFHNSSFSFNIAPPGGGYRSADMQTAMRADYIAGKYQQPPYYLSPPPSPIPGKAGTSRHGFGLAIDVTTNAPVATRNAIMARNGWHLWSLSDPNHFEPNDLDVLTTPPESAFSSGTVTPLNNTTAPALKPKENEMRLISNAKTGEIVWTDFVEHWIPTNTAFQVYSYGRATNQLPEYQPFLDSVNDAGAANTIIHNMVATSGGQLSDDAFNIVKTTYLNLNPGKK